MGIVCGIDLGTQSCKAILYDYTKRKITAQSRASLDLRSCDGGVREQEAEWYQTALLQCFEAFEPADKREIEAIGVSGQQHGFVPLDEEGRPIRAVKLWCDTSAARECDVLTERAGGKEAVKALTGMPFLPGYTAPKILWMKNHEPEAFARLSQVLLPHDYINFLLTGEYCAEAGDASGTALFDVRSRAWSLEACELIDLKLFSCLPAIREPWEPAGRVSRSAAGLYGIPEGAYVAAGGGDNMMGAIGTGTVRQGFLTMSLGTSGTLYGHAEKPLVDQEDRLAAFCSSSGAWLPLLCTMNCTVAVDQARELLELDMEDYSRIAQKAPVGSQGLVLLPFFNGERVPNLPNGKASVQGGRLGNFTRENLARAAMESAVFGFKFGMEAFLSLGFHPKEIRLIGGGAKSSLWRKMIADSLGLPVSIPAGDEAAALGAAIQAIFCLGSQNGEKLSFAEVADLHVAMDESARVEPCPGDFQAWESAYREYRHYLDALKPLFSSAP
jgi:xylulokinase